MLKAHLQERRLQTLQQLEDQGRTFLATASHEASNHWIRQGHYTSFSTYRFALIARLNLLPTGTSQKRIGKFNGDPKCRRCGSQPETLAHVLNHCPTTVGAMREQHNTILGRLIRAVPATMGNKFTEQVVTGDPQGLKPDLVILNDATKWAVVMDVTIAFDLQQNMDLARAIKEEKYAHLIPVLHNRGYTDSSIHAFVVGSLGSWSLGNEVLKRCGIHRNYATLFRKLCCSDAIAGSHFIWKACCTRR